MPHYSKRLTIVPVFLTLFSFVGASSVLEGQVLDRRREIPLPNVTVCLDEITACEKSDSTGNFRLLVPKPGLYSLSASLQEYKTLQLNNIHIKTGNNERVPLFLEKDEEVIQLTTATVRSRKSVHKKQGQTGSVSRISHFALNNSAGTYNDVNRVLEMLPSVVSGVGSSFDNNLYVRGGHPTENVFIIDGIEVDNVSHFGGFDESGGKIGFLNPAVTTGLDFYAGAVPVNLPPRLSSVTDMQFREGSRFERKYQLDANAAGASFMVEGPFSKGKSSYLANFRFADLRFLKPFITTVDGIPRFGDGTVKMVYEPAPNQKLSLTGVMAFDKYDDEWIEFGSDADWHEKLFQYATGAQWKFLGESFRNILFLSLTAKKTSYSHTFGTVPDTLRDSTRIMVENDSMTVGNFKSWFPENVISDDFDNRYSLRMKNHFSLFPRQKDEFNLGVEAGYLGYNIKNQEGRAVEGWYLNLETKRLEDTIQVSQEPFKVDSGLGSWQGGGYAQYVFYLRKLKAVSGLRADYYSLFDELAFSPRLALELALPGLGALSLTGGLFHQVQGRFAEDLEQVLAPPPAESNIKIKLSSMALQRNWQLIAGYERLFKDTWQLTAETYIKFYDREYAMINPWNTEFRADTSTRGDVSTIRLKPPRGEKLVYGAELQFLKKKYDRFYYSLAYSWFNAINRYAEPAGNERWFDDEFNMRNTLSLLVGSNFRHHGVSLRVNASEGKPYSKMNIEEGKFGYSHAVFDKSAGYFSERFDPMLSVHMRYSFRAYRTWGNITGYLEVTNLLNSMPVLDRWYNGRGWQYVRQNGILPVAGVTVDF